MVKEQWDDYFYDAASAPDGSRLLKNKLGIEATQVTHPDEVAEKIKNLKFFEYDLVERRNLQIKEGQVEVLKGSGLEKLQAIHQHLFQDVYQWAGQIRDVPMQKGGKEFAKPGEGQSIC